MKLEIMDAGGIHVVTIGEMTARIADLTAALASEIDAKSEWQCGDGWILGSCPCGDCVQHRTALLLLRRPLPTQILMEDEE
jgi:hypothetical protein